ncbi:MAG: right-handed parallel beta-helix repeat-containing protein [Candidatus Babeliales bacterium]|nr:right-handed parallel beta-helix repeat-containing protein [Candidatus Babeliales bacterium]
MKQFVVSRDLKERIQKYLVLGMLFIHAHAFGSERGFGDVSTLPNINRIKIDALLKQVATQIDAVVALITEDFNNTMTAIAGTQDILAADISACCVLLSSQIDTLSSSTTTVDLNGTYTAIAALQADLDACCITLGNKIDAIASSTASCDFSGTYTMLNAIESDINACCVTLNSKVDALSSTVITDFNNTFTAISGSQNALSSQFEACCVGTFTVLDTINTTVNSIESTLIVLSASNLDQIVNTFTTLVVVSNELLATLTLLEETALFITTTLGALEALLQNVDSELDVLITNVNTGFVGTYTAIVGLQSDLDVCCLTLNSKVDVLSNTVLADFAGTFTAIAAIPAANFSGTYTAIAGLQSDLDVCCLTLNSKVDALSTVVINDFNGTFTAIAAIPAANFSGTYTAIAGLQSDLDVCCVTLNSKVDALSTLVTTDFNGTFTAIAAIQCSGSSTGTVDFNGTYTAIAALESDLDACCNSINTNITTFSANVAQDFNNTFTALAAISSLISQDFNNTMTVLNACCASIVSTFTNSNLCAPTPITSSTTITAPGSYCLANAVGSITISASNVVLDLNGHYISPVGVAPAITIDNTSFRSNIIIKNGFLDGAGTTGDGVETTGSSTVQFLQLLNLDINNFGSDGIDMFNVHGLKIENCNASYNTGNGIIVSESLNIIVQNSSFIGNGANGVSDSLVACTNLLFENCIFNLNTGSGISCGFSTCIKLLECQANANLSNGFTFTVVGGTSPDDMNLEDCIACGNGGVGFVVSTLVGTSAELTGCFAQHNLNGFDMSGSFGNGLIQNCKAVNNTTCGFKDNTFSLYQYVGNVGQHNDGTPAVPAGDSNYCWADLAQTSTFIAPSGPGFAPYYQNGRNTNGGMFGISSWDNVTLK